MEGGMSLKLVWREVSRNVSLTLAYRWGFFLFMFAGSIPVIISLLVWLRMEEAGIQLPYTRGQFVTYYLMLRLAVMLTSTWAAEYVAADIRSGNLSDTLVRPAPCVIHNIANNIGEKIIKLPLLLPILLLIAFFFRADLQLPADPWRWLGFLCCLPLAAVIAFLLDLVIGLLAFWITDVDGLVRVKVLVSAFLAGQIVPLALFPPSMAGFLEAQPFRYTLSFPLELLTGNLSAEAVGRGLLWQIGYCVGLWALYELMWRRGLRAYVATGR
jgi:ABC-2 type transport system permease protein